jgi:hypothetical protein
MSHQNTNLAKRLFMFGGFIAAMIYFFRFALFHHDYLQFGDHYEGFIEISILEHWNNVLHGAAHWSETNYFYPETATLALNDGYLVYGLLHALFRSLSFDVLLSAELVNVVVRASGFWLLYAAARRLAGFDWRWALLAAMLFTVSNGVYEQMFHAQLLSVSFAPGLALLFHFAVRALVEDRRKALLGWGGGFVAAYAAWLMTAFYMAWFFALFLLIFLAVWLTMAPKGSAAGIVRAIGQQWLPLLGLAIFALVVDIPFLRLYLPAAARTGGHDASMALSFSPSLLDVINVGDKNLVWGGLNVFIREHLRPGFPLHSELNSGFPPFLLALFGISTIVLFRRGDAMLRAAAIATVVSCALFMHVKGFSLYPLVHDLVPGAAAVRAIARYQLFAAAPLIVVALAAPSRLGGLALLLAVPLLAEEFNGDQIDRINRPYELARMAAIPAPPANCRAFYIARDRGEPFLTKEISEIYSMSADAMLIAEVITLPTINGFASFLPPGYDLFRPEQPDYAERVRLYAEKHGINELCGLDLRDMRWSQ